GNLTVTGSATWQAGTLSGAGTLTLGAGATLTVQGAAAKTLARVIDGQGRVVFSGGTTTANAPALITAPGRVEIHVAATLTGTVTLNGPVTNAGGLTITGNINGSVNNSGTMQVTGNINGQVNNSGDLRITGNINTGGNPVTNSGTLRVIGNINGNGAV